VLDRPWDVQRRCPFRVRPTEARRSDRPTRASDLHDLRGGALPLGAGDHDPLLVGWPEPLSAAHRRCLCWSSDARFFPESHRASRLVGATTQASDEFDSEQRGSCDCHTHEDSDGRNDRRGALSVDGQDRPIRRGYSCSVHGGGHVERGTQANLASGRAAWAARPAGAASGNPGAAQRGGSTGPGRFSRERSDQGSG